MTREQFRNIKNSAATALEPPRKKKTSPPRGGRGAEVGRWLENRPGKCQIQRVKSVAGNRAARRKKRAREDGGIN